MLFFMELCSQLSTKICDRRRKRRWSVNDAPEFPFRNERTRAAAVRHHRLVKPTIHVYPFLPESSGSDTSHIQSPDKEAELLWALSRPNPLYAMELTSVRLRWQKLRGQRRLPKRL